MRAQEKMGHSSMSEGWRNRANLVPANNPLRQLMDKLRDPQVHAGKLKFFDNPQNNQLVYILPGNSIYLAYSKLLEKPGYDLNREQIEALTTPRPRMCT